MPVTGNLNPRKIVNTLMGLQAKVEYHLGIQLHIPKILSQSTTAITWPNSEWQRSWKEEMHCEMAVLQSCKEGLMGTSRLLARMVGIPLQ